MWENARWYKRQCACPRGTKVIPGVETQRTALRRGSVSCPVPLQAPASPRVQSRQNSQEALGHLGGAQESSKCYASIPSAREEWLQESLGSWCWCGLMEFPVSHEARGATGYFPEGLRSPQREASLEKLWTSKEAPASIWPKLPWRPDRNQAS